MARTHKSDKEEWNGDFRYTKSHNVEHTRNEIQLDGSCGILRGEGRQMSSGSVARYYRATYLSYKIRYLFLRELIRSSEGCKTLPQRDQ